MKPGVPARGPVVFCVWLVFIVRCVGSAPELLAVGETGATSVVIPAMYTFAPGSLYQLFMKGRNGRGAGEASPSVSWTA